MGVDLKLLPTYCRIDPAGVNFSHEIIGLHRDKRLWSDIAEIQEHYGCNVPENFTAYVATLENGEIGYGCVTKDRYGTTLQYVPAFALKPLSTNPFVQESFKNKAVFAYINELPDVWPIVLFWH